MTALEKLIAVADEETIDLACRLIGKNRLALLIAKGAAHETNTKVSCMKVSKTFGISPGTANQWIRKTDILENVSTNPEEVEVRLGKDARDRITRILRLRLRSALKVRDVSPEQTMELIGCSVHTLCAHLESQFTVGMSWSNYPAWHIDHKRPCASFDLRDPEQQRQCFNYKNLQPLWAKDNMRKGARYVAP